MALRSGFPWWLPLLTAAIAALIAVIAAQSTASAWDADVHLWASGERPAADFADILLDPSIQDSAADGLMATEFGRAAIDDVSIEYTDTLIRLTVRAETESDAELLAVSLAQAALDEARSRFGDDSGLDLLGLVRPGARKVAPLTELSAAWASAVGLAAGLILAWTVAARSQPATSPPSALGRLGRSGLRPLAVLNPRSEHAPALTSAIRTMSGVVAITSLHADAPVPSQLMQSATRLAADKTVLWLDARRPAFQPTFGAPPFTMRFVEWSPMSRSGRIRQAALGSAANAGDAGCVLLILDSLSDPDSVAVTRAASDVILIARADTDADELVNAKRTLNSSPLRGVVLTNADESDQLDFELAQLPE